MMKRILSLFCKTETEWHIQTAKIKKDMSAFYTHIRKVNTTRKVKLENSTGTRRICIHQAGTDFRVKMRNLVVMRKMKKNLVEITFYKGSKSKDSFTCLQTTDYDVVGNHDKGLNST